MAAADAACLVVSAVPAKHEPALRRDGQSWNHMIATKSMVGISHFIVAVTKMDLVDYSREAFDAVCNKVGHAMAKCGISADGAVFVPLSGLRKENIYTPSDLMPWAANPSGHGPGKGAMDDAKASQVGGARWRTAPTLLDAIDQLKISRVEQLPLPFRLMVDEVLNIRGVGPVACGVVTAGTAKVGDHVVWGGETRPHLRATIKSIQHFHKPSDTCKAGDMVGVSLRYQHGTDRDPVTKGDVLGSAAAPPLYGDSIDAQVTMTGKVELKVGSKPVMVVGTCRVVATIAHIAAIVEPHGKAIEVDQPSTMTLRHTYMVRLELARPVPAETYAPHARFARLILMTGNVTAGLGRVHAVCMRANRARAAGR